jgi:hypothetical protein
MATTREEQKEVLYPRGDRQCMKVIFEYQGWKFSETVEKFLAAVEIIDRLRTSWLGECALETAPQVDFSTRERLEMSFCDMAEVAEAEGLACSPKIGYAADGESFSYETGKGTARIEISVYKYGIDGEALWQMSGHVYAVNPSTVLRKLWCKCISAEVEKETIMVSSREVVETANA